MATTHYRNCNLCEALCGLAIQVEDNRIVSIRGDSEDGFSRGYLCPKGVALQDIHEDPDRIKTPLKRTADGWAPIGWDQALDEAARGLAAVRRAHGRHAIALYHSNPNAHSMGGLTYGQFFVRSFRSHNLYSATSADQLPHMLAALYMFGSQVVMPVPDLERTPYWLIMGGNPVVSNGSLMSAPNVRQRLKDIQARGGRVVVIDPRRSETAAMADAWHAIRPGGDACLLLALLHVLFAENLAAPGRLANFSDGLPAIRDLARRFPPERVAERTGIEAETIRSLAREIAAAPAAALYGRIGICTQEFGGLSAWLLYVLNVVTGNLDRPGGMMFTTPAVDVPALAALLRARGSYGRWRSRARGLPEFGDELPLAAMAEEMEEPGPGQIRALVTLGGNPVLSAPNGARIERALPGLEFMVAIDFYRNETSCHANLILPPTAALERDHYDLTHFLAVRNVAKYAPPLFPRGSDQRHDWEIFLELGCRLAEQRGPGGRLLGAALRRLGRGGPRSLLDILLRLGPHGKGWRPWGKGLTVAELEQHPHGVDLGPLQPRLPGLLQTPGRRIQLAPALFLADVARLERDLDGPATDPARPLALIGRRQLRSNNSWMHNSLRLVRGRPRCTLLMHPTDATARGLATGQTVVVTSRVGRIEVPLEVSDEMRPGVVSLPHGWGHHRPGIQLQVAQAHAGTSINDLTDETLVDELSGTAGFSGVPVEVAAGPQGVK